MKFYEFVLLLNQEINVSDIEKLIDRYKEMTNKLGALFVNHEYWGIRNIFHQINGNKKAHFIFFKIKSTSLIFDRIKEDYKYDEMILKSFEIKTDASTEASPMLQTIDKQR